MVEIKRAENKDIPGIVDLHIQNLSRGYLPKLGKPFLVETYKSFLILEPDLQYTSFVDGKLVGFASGTSDSPTLLRRAIRANMLGMVSTLIEGIIKNPGNIALCFKLILYPGFSKYTDLRPELLAIAISPSMRGKGIGTMLVKQITESFKQKDIKSLKLSVWPDLPANQFYKNQGFKFLGSEKFLDGETNFYRLVIS